MSQKAKTNFEKYTSCGDATKSYYVDKESFNFAAVLKGRRAITAKLEVSDIHVLKVETSDMTQSIAIFVRIRTGTLMNEHLSFMTKKELHV